MIMNNLKGVHLSFIQIKGSAINVHIHDDSHIASAIEIR